MPYTNLTFAAFLTLAVEDVHLPEWCRRSEVRRLLSVVISILMAVHVDVYRLMTDEEVVAGFYK
ncbi:hypothetical protein HanPSC8_Chr04g0176781 [Helianthus annuus]|nr:hypothetical protein HanIR_Chr04g0197341 [Helianthus annuus]KAJ0932712.1 hypothetical protein HanPSC8_Chr04g0176781 [Helianthus annuus]